MTYEPMKTEGIPSQDYTDEGQAKMFLSVNSEVLRYNSVLGWLYYTGNRWKPSEMDAQRLAQELTERQFDESLQRLNEATIQLNDIMANPNGNEDIIASARRLQSNAEKYRKYALSRRKYGAISSCLKAATSRAKQVYLSDLDADPYLLNTPAGTIDLKTGAMHPHSPADMQTKITAVSPSADGADIWDAFLDKITGNNKRMKDFLQCVAGMVLCGEVKTEVMVIAVGTGGNGKSTFFNTLSRVLSGEEGNNATDKGGYASQIDPGLLVTDGKSADSGKKFELVDLKGQRLVLAAELEEGVFLSDGMVKRICSTDNIKGAIKHKQGGVEFKPSHTLILFTNYLPRVKSTDEGIWKRLCVIPFNVRIRGTADDIKDYTSFLVKSAGGAVLKWMVDGARMFIAAGGSLAYPQEVQEEVNNYLSENDWLGNFIRERCRTGIGFTVGSETLYMEYLSFCRFTGDYPRTRQQLKKELEKRQYYSKHSRDGNVYINIALKDDEPVTQIDEAKNAQKVLSISR